MVPVKVSESPTVEPVRPKGVPLSVPDAVKPNPLESEAKLTTILCVSRAHVLLVRLQPNPAFDPLHSDPRYQDLIRRIGLPQAPPTQYPDIMDIPNPANRLRLFEKAGRALSLFVYCSPTTSWLK
jgi:hypothetical protein